MFSNDLCKVGTSVKLQASVITCINSGIVPLRTARTACGPDLKGNLIFVYLRCRIRPFAVLKSFSICEVTLHNENFLL
jgi:hypothetical protein